jgi:hypothetical protein
MELPLHGMLKFNDLPLGIGDVFSRDDLMNGRLAYVNEGDAVEGKLDNFIIDVTDGVHHVPIKLNVDITSVDDEAPKLIGVTGGILEIVVKVILFHFYFDFCFLSHVLLALLLSFSKPLPPTPSTS